jgi:hypothetical protein
MIQLRIAKDTVGVAFVICYLWQRTKRPLMHYKMSPKYLSHQHRELLATSNDLVLGLFLVLGISAQPRNAQLEHALLTSLRTASLVCSKAISALECRQH